MRTAYRTLRSTAALVFWLAKWGVVLYAVLLAYLWYTHETPSSTHHALAGLNSLFQGRSAD